MMFSCITFLLKRRRAFSPVSPSWSITSANCHLHPAPILAVASFCLFRRRRDLFRDRSRFDLRQLFRQFLAGLETRISFRGDGDGLPGARIAALALLPLFHHEAAETAKVYPFVCL